jgi:hypothetical protein
MEGRNLWSDSEDMVHAASTLDGSTKTAANRSALGGVSVGGHDRGEPMRQIALGILLALTAMIVTVGAILATGTH